MKYPICKNCKRSILVHHLRGHLSYCEEVVKDGLRGSFSVVEINKVQKNLGHPISHTAREEEKKELEGQEGLKL